MHHSQRDTFHLSFSQRMDGIWRSVFLIFMNHLLHTPEGCFFVSYFCLLLHTHTHSLTCTQIHTSIHKHTHKHTHNRESLRLLQLSVAPLAISSAGHHPHKLTETLEISPKVVVFVYVCVCTLNATGGGVNVCVNSCECK